MTPEQALLRVIHCLDRVHEIGFKTKAFVRALDVVRTTDPVELAERARDERLTELDGIGDSTAAVITEALAGVDARLPHQARSRDGGAITARGAEYRDALRGDCHLHSTWSDGGATIEEMAAHGDRARARVHGAHRSLGPADDRPRARRERLPAQLDDIAGINADIAAAGPDFRILTGMEVDILEDGSLDLDDDLLARLDVVVASVHSKLRMERHADDRSAWCWPSPTRTSTSSDTAPAGMIGKRPESTFDADYVFAACAQFGTAVEINCRPERLDPPTELLDLAHRVRLLLLDRLRRPRHRPAGVAAARLRAGRRSAGCRSSA